MSSHILVPRLGIYFPSFHSLFRTLIAFRFINHKIHSFCGVCAHTARLWLLPTFHSSPFLRRNLAVRKPSHPSIPSNLPVDPTLRRPATMAPTLVRLLARQIQNCTRTEDGFIDEDSCYVPFWATRVGTASLSTVGNY